MNYSVKNKDDFRDLEEFKDLQWKVTQVKLEEKLDQQGFQNDTRKILWPKTKTINKTNGNTLERSKATSAGLKMLLLTFVDLAMF